MSRERLAVLIALLLVCVIGMFVSITNDRTASKPGLNALIIATGALAGMSMVAITEAVRGGHEGLKRKGVGRPFTRMAQDLRGSTDGGGGAGGGGDSGG